MHHAPQYESSEHSCSRDSSHNPLIHSLQPSDYASARHRSSRCEDPESLPKTAIADEHILASHGAVSSAAKLNAARRLAAQGVHEFTASDENGQQHHMRIETKHEHGGTDIKVSDDTGNGEHLSLSGQVSGEGKPHVDFAEDNPDMGERAAERQIQQESHSHIHHRRSLPTGMSYGGGHYRYAPHFGGRTYNPDPAYADQVDPDTWKAVQAPDGSVVLESNGCRVDTDGSGASRHTEDGTRDSQTSLRLANGQSLDTDKANYFVLPPSVANAYHIKLGDLGWLVRKDTGEAVPIMFGDRGPNNPNKFGEASVHTLKALNFPGVSGANGVDGTKFQIIFYPGSGNGTGDLASDPKAMAAIMNQLSQEKGGGQATHVQDSST